MRLVIADVEEPALESAAAKLAADGHEVMPVRTDVSDAASVAELADAVYERLGAVHVLCNNAGVAGGGLAWEVDLETWSWVLGVNLMGVVHGVHAFVPRMIAGGEEGHIVNTASIAGLTSNPLMAPYNVSKHGVVTLSETLLGDLRLVGASIGVSVLCPGWVQTRIHEADRNRPGMTEVGPEADAMAQVMREMVGQMIAGGMEPGDVAAEVLAAVKDRRFYVKTHRGMDKLVAERCDAVVAGTDPPVTTPAEITGN